MIPSFYRNHTTKFQSCTVTIIKLAIPHSVRPSNLPPSIVNRSLLRSRATPICFKAHVSQPALQWDSLLSQHLMPPTWSSHIYTQTCVVSFANLTESSVIRVLLSQGFRGSKRSLPKIRGRYRQHAEPGQTLRLGVSQEVLSQASPNTERLL